jgi:hypothetical protein
MQAEITNIKIWGNENREVIIIKIVKIQNIRITIFIT